MNTAKDLMKEPITINKTAKMSDVIKKLLENDISRLLVIDNGKASGIVTEKDIALFLFKDQTQRNLNEIPLTEIMRDIVFVDDSAKIKECANKMLDKEISSLAVGSSNNLQGIFTKTDLAKHYAENFKGKKTVGEYMATVYSWAYAKDPLYKVISKMIEKRISRIVLRNENEAPVGIMSFRDLFRIALDFGNEKDIEDNTQPDISIVFSRKGFLSESGFGGVTSASQIMKNNIISVNYDDDLAKACDVMLKNKINGAAVLSGRGTLVGIISKTDVTLAIATTNV